VPLGLLSGAAVMFARLVRGVFKNDALVSDAVDADDVKNSIAMYQGQTPSIL
jgi:hypothetical protein